MSESERQPVNGWQTLVSSDAIYVDACTWMAPEIGEFLQKAKPVLAESGKKLIIIPSVRKELESCALLKLAAQTALSYIEQNADVIDSQEGEESTGTADKQFLRLFHFNQYHQSQLLITHDQQLAVDIENICSAEGPNPVSVLTLWPDGDLISFAEMARRKSAQARARLAEMVGNSPLYMDRSALVNPNADLFLQNVAEPMQQQGKWVQVVRASLNLPDDEPIIAPLFEANSELLHIVETNPNMPEVDSLLGELYLSDANTDADRIILVTDDVAKANELRGRRPKCDRFPFVDFMTINKYGFLSFLKLSEPGATPATYTVGRPQRPRSTYGYTGGSDWAGQEKKPSSFVPQLIGAIKNDDIEGMCEYIDKGANLRNGIITSLCQGKNNCLRVLIERADSVEASCFQWWVYSFYNFADPFYLDEDEEHYTLLSLMMDKCGSLEYCKDAMAQLARLVSRPEAAHARLWSIIRKAIGKEAPANVYSQETGESLAEIAARQGNQDMVDFLSVYC